jgi:formylglycine-generating enzyme required for sulfatase activity
MKRLLHLLSVLLVAAILPACSKKPVNVTGQVFVVTKSRENIKMGGLDVYVIPDSAFKASAKSVVSWMLDEAKKEAQSQADSDFMTSFIEEVIVMEKNFPEHRSKFEPIRMGIAKESGIANEIIQRASAAELKKRAIAKLIEGCATKVTVTTDADGRFVVLIKEKTWFVSTGERAVGDETEKYLWVKSYEAPAKMENATMTISNDADIDSEDALYTIMKNAIGSQAELNESKKIGVSDQMRTMVVRYRQQADAAKATAERERATAPKADRERYEAWAKLISTIQSGAIGKTVDVPLPGGSLMRMAYCPAGSFTMGNTASEAIKFNYDNQVQVRISKAFWLGKTELNQAQWRAVMGENPSSFKGDDLPVENVSWEDAQEFVKKVNGSGVIPEGWKFTLPTEAQWEYACRSGETGPYSGGNVEQVAWYDENSASKTHPVGTKKPNDWGLQDMHGNVEEWCVDWWGTWYDKTLPSLTDPSGPSQGDSHVFRGGSFNMIAGYCRAAHRNGRDPNFRASALGFRPALVPSE